MLFYFRGMTDSEFYEWNTEGFINYYLNPNSTDPIESFEDMEGLYCVYEERVVRAIRKLKYKDFLRTLYWRIISNEVKRRFGNRCALCNSNQKLNTHHRTYSIHGKEISSLETLTCLCANCHSKFHNK